MIFHLENEKKLQVLRITNQKLRLMGTNAFNQIICTLWSHCGSSAVVGAQMSEQGVSPNPHLQVPSRTVHLTGDCPFSGHDVTGPETKCLLCVPCVHTANTPAFLGNGVIHQISVCSAVAPFLQAHQAGCPAARFQGLAPVSPA